MDLNYLVNQIKGESNIPTLRLRQAYVVAVHNSPKRVDIQLAGDTNTLPSVKYIHSYAPQVADTIFVLTNGSDILCLGDIAT
ncbi:hypothetical protein uvFWCGRAMDCOMC203_060 [Freshwater phage uvFW-CGR-AMD-COM-C203]|nr:hypothetical protein uvFWCGRAMDCOMC203_060 [Freshwater phage uvFW-CGR-AMD-COM-C203]